MIILLAVNAAAGDIVQASENAWREHMNPMELEVLNVTADNAVSVLASKLKEMDEDAMVVVSDASVMPLRRVPLSLMDMPFTYRLEDDRHVLPFVATAGEISQLLEHGKNIIRLADLKTAVQQLHGHVLPFETGWQNDCLLLPIASKNPEKGLVSQFVRTKYFIRFKPGCVSPVTIRMMREFFPTPSSADGKNPVDNPTAPKDTPAEEGEKNKEEEI